MNDDESPTNCRITGETMASVFMLNCCAATTSTGNDAAIAVGDYSVAKSTKLLGGASGDGNILNDTTRDSSATITAIPRGGGGKTVDALEGMTIISYLNYESPSCSSKRRGSPLTTPATTPRTSNNRRMELMDTSANAADERSKPFASSPLIYRGDHSLMDQSSVLSLIYPETMDTIPSPEMNDRQQNSTPPTLTPARRQQNQYHPDNFTTYTPARSISSSSITPPLPPDSPMMELSMAKQCANVTQMSNGNFRKHNREVLRNYRTVDGIGIASQTSPSKKARDVSSVGSDSTSTRAPQTPVVAAGAWSTPPRLPPTQGSRDENDLRTSSDVLGNESGTITPSSNASIHHTMAVGTRPHYDFEDATPPPLWTESITSTSPDINSELLLTYKYPRLYLQDPAEVINCQWSNNQKIKRLWWFQLAQRMNTTLGHVQDGRWKNLLRLQQFRNSSNNTLCSDSSASASSYSAQQSPLCSTLDGSSKAMRALCLGKPKHPSKGETSSSIGSGEDPATVGETPAAFQPGACPQNAWSEPSASTMNVRGKTYLKDATKVASETSIFSVLGVDSFVSGGKGAEDVSWATRSYLQRWNVACEEMGLVRPPFLLIMNFIVPWGNFQVYFTRPDADEGPFSSRHKNRPSERLLREFLEGTTEYRNSCFKLIPRICAGPWMVKKMVGSTPALIGTKLPTSYRGSIDENYLEIILDVAGGSAFGNSAANSVVGKADAIAVDIGFVIEGQVDGHLPEQMLGLVRFHRINMSAAPTKSKWEEFVAREQTYERIDAVAADPPSSADEGNGGGGSQYDRPPPTEK